MTLPMTPTQMSDDATATVDERWTQRATTNPTQSKADADKKKVAERSSSDPAFDVIRRRVGAAFLSRPRERRLPTCG